MPSESRERSSEHQNRENLRREQEQRERQRQENLRRIDEARGLSLRRDAPATKAGPRAGEQPRVPSLRRDAPPSQARPRDGEQPPAPSLRDEAVRQVEREHRDKLPVRLEHNEYPGGSTIVAFDDRPEQRGKRVQVGRITVSIENHPAGKRARVNHVEVPLKEHRGQGVGKRLLVEGEQYARRSGAGVLYGDIQDADAHRFFERSAGHGYKIEPYGVYGRVVKTLS